MIKIDNMTRNKIVVVLQGGSGSGKTSVIKRLQLKGYCKVTTDTTRKPKDNEVDGIDYNFRALEEFNANVQQGLMLETASYAGNLYGTSKLAMESALKDNDIVLIILETQGAKLLKESYPNNVIIISFPISEENMKRNLRARKDMDGDITKRLQNAKDLRESEAPAIADYVISGNNLSSKVNGVICIITAEALRNR